MAIPNTYPGEVEVGESHRENYEAKLIDIETTLVVFERRPCRKKTRVYNTEPLFLMKGKGRSFITLEFNQNQRATFVQVLMKYGNGSKGEFSSQRLIGECCFGEQTYYHNGQ